MFIVMENEVLFNSIFGFSEGVWIVFLLCGLIWNEVLLFLLLECIGGIFLVVFYNGILFCSVIIVCVVLLVLLFYLWFELGLGVFLILIYGFEF